MCLQRLASSPLMEWQALSQRALVRPTGRSSRLRPGGRMLFDDAAVQQSLVAEVLAAFPWPIAAADATPTAGVYGLRYAGDHPSYQRLTRLDFIYIGKATYLPERVSSHAKSLNEAHDLDIEHFTISLVPLASVIHAQVAEHLLIGAFDPLWCRRGWTGFGSRPQGAGRAGQRPTDWDLRHPGRVSRHQAASGSSACPSLS